MSRIVGITARVDLGDIAEGWDGCFAVVTKASYAEYAELSRFSDAVTDDESAQAANGYAFVLHGINLAKKHFVSGRIKVLDEEGSLVDGDMYAEDIEDNRELADRLIAAVTGVLLDPKVSSTTKPEKSSTETPSSAQ